MNRQEFEAKFEAGATSVADWIGAHKEASIRIALFVGGFIIGWVIG